MRLRLSRNRQSESQTLRQQHSHQSELLPRSMPGEPLESAAPIEQPIPALAVTLTRHLAMCCKPGRPVAALPRISRGRAESPDLVRPLEWRFGSWLSSSKNVRRFSSQFKRHSECVRQTHLLFDRAETRTIRRFPCLLSRRQAEAACRAESSAHPPRRPRVGTARRAISQSY